MCQTLKSSNLTLMKIINACYNSMIRASEFLKITMYLSRCNIYERFHHVEAKSFENSGAYCSESRVTSLAIFVTGKP